MMKATEIREEFLNFFSSKQHKIVPSAPMVIKNDPTLMFTNAGMNQFKDIFLGNQPAQYKRVANSQKCLRVSGKHNDLEEVGLDTYHHTMFEMLGNWSFGDYFKKEAINWAWEFLTGRLHIPEDRIYTTIFEGSREEKVPRDDEAAGQWMKCFSNPENRIIEGSKKDNFWEMGETGPCGPCSEIHIDIRPDSERSVKPGHLLVNTGHPHVIELWNLVFIQYNRKAGGELELLPERHVDTGMGFERLCMVIQGRKSNYDTDIFQPLIAAPPALGGALSLSCCNIDPRERRCGRGDCLARGHDLADQLFEMRILGRQRVPAGFGDAAGLLVQRKRIEAHRAGHRLAMGEAAFGGHQRVGVARGHLDEIAEHAVMPDLERGHARLVAVLRLKRGDGAAGVRRDQPQLVERGVVALGDEAALAALGRRRRHERARQQVGQGAVAPELR